MRRTRAWLLPCFMLSASIASALPPASFAPKVDYSTGTSPQAVAIGDLSGDGTPDLAVVNYGPASNTVSVFIGSGAGTFGPRTDYSVGTNPISISIGDLNADGRPDLTIANWSSSNVSVLLGTGGGAFGPRTNYSTGAGRPISGRLADLNGDGRLDLVVADWSVGAIKVLLGNGSGGFAAAVSYPAGSLPYGLAIGDLNADGRTDAVVTNRSGTTASVLLGVAGGGFGPAVGLTVGLDPISAALADVNADGKLDLAIANQGGGTVSVMLGNGAGGFGAKTDYASGPAPLSVTFADVDLDGHPDLLVSDYPSNVVSVRSGNGAGGFGAKLDFVTGSGPTRIAIGDLNADGKPDLAVPDAISEKLSVLLSTNAGAIGVPSAANSTCPTSVRIGADGTCCFDVTVRDLANNPVAGATLAIDFGACLVMFCPTQPPGVVVNGPANTVSVITGPSGQAHCCICTVAGPIAPCTATLFADGVQLCSLPVDTCATPVISDTCVTEGWQLVANSGPDARWSSAMVANDARGTIFLYGGAHATNNYGDTWEWDGSEWHQTATSGPYAREGHAMAYDRARGRVVLFGGRVAGAWDQQTWEWDAANGWILRAGGGPSPRAGHVMAWDENRKQVILFGGFDGSVTLADTWAWDGNTWTALGGAAPPARMKAAMATDPLRKRVVLFGGSATAAAAGALGDTWEFDGTSWARVEMPVWNGSGFDPVAVVGPPARWRHGMAFGASCGRIVMTGGELASGQLAPTTWSWDGATWREGVSGVAASSAPIAYDIAQGRVTVFGGSTGAGLIATTSQLCTPCDDEAAELDSLGNVVYPPTLDPNEPITETEIDEDRGETGALYPGFHTSADSWLKDFPCATAIGGSIPDEAENPALDDSLLAMGIGVSAQAMADSMASWEAQLTELFQSDPDSLPFAPPVGDGAYPLPAQPYCPPDSGNYVFGGRDIVFVHGLQLDHIFKKIGAVFSGNFTHGSLTDWVPPTAGVPGYLLNPEFYRSESSPGAGDGGFYRQIADDNWAPHITKFFTERGIKNRYLIIAYPCNDRLEVGIQAMLTQINDAMRYGINVKNPPGRTDVAKFGTPSFVIVSHSTGGLLADAALHAAQANTNLNARFIADRCKAHIGLASALSGSRLATSALVVAGAISAVTTVSDPWICPLFETVMALDGVTDLPPCPITFSIAARSVLVDLVPGYSKWRWGDAIDNTNIPTVNLIGAHSQMIPILKHTISPGFDDGVLTVNSASANPGTTLLWPSGFMTMGIPGRILTFDMGMAKTQPTRAVQYFLDQTLDPKLQRVTTLIPFYTSAGPIPYLSPTGMLQTVGWEFTGTGFDANRRYDQHYSFMACASDHFNIRSAAQYPDYMRHLLWNPPPFFTESYEESRAIRQEDETALRAHYNTIGSFHYPNDDQPLLTAACTPAEHDYVKGVQRGFKIKIFGKTYSKYWWIWKRHYIRPANIVNKHACDYLYESVLNCESPVGLCDNTTDAPAPGSVRANYARVLANPVRGGDAAVEFGLTAASRVRIRVYDLAGRTVHEFGGGMFAPGVHRLRWNGRDEQGTRIRAGVYFLRVEFTDQRFLSTSKVMLIQ